MGSVVVKRALHVLSASPGLTVQDLGRPGYLAQGVSCGGAADPLALYEGAALLGQAVELAALELAVAGASFRAEGAMRVALTGADMALRINDQPFPANTAVSVPDGATIQIGAARSGVYGYLHVDGGIATARQLGSRSVHTAAGIGGPLQVGAHVPLGQTHPGPNDVTLTPFPRLGGGTVRVTQGFQTDLFSAETRAQFEAVEFQRDMHGNRQGVRLSATSVSLSTPGGLTVLSETIVPGDIQITGDGAPFVLLADCQTTGGYPRLATVLPSDLPRVAQAAPGDRLRFHMVTLDQAVEAHARYNQDCAALPRQVRPRFRAPEDMSDLLSYQLISGAITGWDED